MLIVIENLSRRGNLNLYDTMKKRDCLAHFARSLMAPNTLTARRSLQTLLYSKQHFLTIIHIQPLFLKSHIIFNGLVKTHATSRYRGQRKLVFCAQIFVLAVVEYYPAQQARVRGHGACKRA